MRCSA